MFYVSKILSKLKEGLSDDYYDQLYYMVHDIGE